MNLKALALVASIVTSLAAVGCKSSHEATNSVGTQAAAPAGAQAQAIAAEAIAPEENVATAPVNDAKAPGIEKDCHRSRYYAAYAPPAARYEVIGRAPSSRHFWAPGYYRWNGREHTWYGGRWEIRRDGYDYVSPRWANSNGRWEYLPGYWGRRS